MDPPKKREALARLTELERGCQEESAAVPDRTDPIAVVFHPHTLGQLAYLRSALTDLSGPDSLSGTGWRTALEPGGGGVGSGGSQHMSTPAGHRA